MNAPHRGQQRRKTVNNIHYLHYLIELYILFIFKSQQISLVFNLMAWPNIRHFHVPVYVLLSFVIAPFLYIVLLRTYLNR